MPQPDGQSVAVLDAVARSGRTLNAWLERAAEFPDTGLRLLDRRGRETWLPWPIIRKRARSAAGALAAEGVAPGDRVVLIYPTCTEFFDAFFGILLAGAVPVPLYPPVRLGRLDEYHRKTAAMIRAVDARLILTESRLRRLLGTAVRAAPPPLGCRTLEELPPGSVPEVEVGPSSLALVQFSSGTTVDPKPVILSHRAVLSQVQALNGFWPEGARDETGRLIEDSGVSWLPLYHDMGLIGCVFPALERPGTLTLIGPEVFVARPSVWLRAISKYRATISVAPNFAYGLCVEKIRDEELQGVDLSGWRVALNGAEAVAPSVLQSFQTRFARWGFRPEAMTPVYGLSEAALAVTFSDLRKTFRVERFDRQHLSDGEAVPNPDGVERVSVGRPLPGFELRIVGPDGGEVAACREGRILVRGPSLMDGYFNRPDATRAALRDGWLDTGDLGFLFDGELFLTGRAKDVIILRGRNYAPADLEHCLDSVDGVRKGCVVAVSHLPDGGREEELLLFVESARDASSDRLVVLGRECADLILGTQGLRPDAVFVLEPGTLPRTSSGKLRRQETLRRHLSSELSAPSKVTPFFLTKALARSAWDRARTKRERHGR